MTGQVSRRERIGIIADDITGCGDAGLHFADKGAKTLVMLNPVQLRTPLRRGWEVLVVNTESRVVPPTVASYRVKTVLKFFLKQGVKKIYKKIDSTLRGNLGPEIDAVIETMDIQTLPLCAAFPQMGRVTDRGYHYVHGQPIHKTVFARDPRNPVRESYLSRLIERSSRYSDRVSVYDARTPLDLKRAAHSLANVPVVCGAAGLAGELSGLWFSPKERREDPDPRGEGPVLVVSGSANPVNREQIKGLIEKREVRPFPLSASPKTQKRGDIVIFPEKKIKDPSLIVTEIANLAQRICLRNKIKRLILVGGETAYRILTGLSMGSFWLYGSVLPGIAWGRSTAGEYTIILKPGGFGKRDTLVKCLDFLKVH